MVNNSTNINKTNNHLSPSLSEHKKKTDIRNPRYGLGHGAKMWAELKGLMGSQHPS